MCGLLQMRLMCRRVAMCGLVAHAQLRAHVRVDRAGVHCTRLRESKVDRGCILVVDRG